MSRGVCVPPHTHTHSHITLLPTLSLTLTLTPAHKTLIWLERFFLLMRLQSDVQRLVCVCTRARARARACVLAGRRPGVCACAFDVQRLVCVLTGRRPGVWTCACVCGRAEGWGVGKLVGCGVGRAEGKK